MDVFPLSFAQHRLLALHAMDPTGFAHSVGRVYQVDGPLDPAALQRAMDILVDRHEPLRTTFPAGAPAMAGQHVAAHCPVRLAHADLAGRPAEVPAAVARIQCEPFRPATGPLLRACLLRTGQDRYLLVLSMHLLAADGWGWQVFCGDLAEAYRAQLAGEPPDLPALPVQYADWSRWQRDRLAGPRAAGLALRWRAMLAGLPLTLTLPGGPGRTHGTHCTARTARTACTARTRRGPVSGWQARQVPADLLADVRALAARQRTTVFVVLAACCGAVVGRLAGQRRLVLGLALASRDHPEVGGLLGFFVNSVPLPIDLTGNPRLSTLLQRIADSTANACTGGELPFEQIVAAVNPPGNTGRSPVVQVMFAHHPAGSTGVLRLAGCLVKERAPAAGSAKFELTIRVREEESGGATLTAEYDATLVDDGAAGDLLADYIALLAAAAGQPEARLGDLLPGLRESAGRWRR
jgi:Condensation domain